MKAAAETALNETPSRRTLSALRGWRGSVA